jgi:hypothetical protein
MEPIICIRPLRALIYSERDPDGAAEKAKAQAVAPKPAGAEADVAPRAARRPAGRGKKDSSPYGLMVTIRLKRTDLPKFFKLASSLTKAFKAGGLLPRMSGWEVVGPDAGTSTPVPPGRQNENAPASTVVELFSIWYLEGNDADSLRKAMSYLFDVIAYYQLDSLQLDEYKVLGLRLVQGIAPDASSPGMPAIDLAKERYVYVRVTNTLRTQDLAELRARFRAGMWRFCRQTGWRLGDAYLGLTGFPNTVTQVWLVPEGSYARFSTILATASWDSLLKQPPEYRVLQPSPFDLVLGDSAREAAIQKALAAQAAVAAAKAPLGAAAGGAT